MPGILERATTFTVPNHVGPLFFETPQDTKFLSMLGGLTGGKEVHSSYFQWTGWNLRHANQRTAKEGQDAPSPSHRRRFPLRNVTQIHHETVDVSWRKQGATQQFADVGSAHPNIDGLESSNAVANELSFQVMAMRKQIARDVNFSFIRGRYFESNDNTDANRTRGMIQAVQTNRVNAGTSKGTFTVTVADPGVFTTSAHDLSNGDEVTFVEGEGGLPTIEVPSNETAAGVMTKSVEEGVTYFVSGITATTFRIALTPGGAELKVTHAGTTHGTRLVYEAADFTRARLDELMQSVYDQGGISEEESAVLWVPPGNIGAVSAAYLGATAGYRQGSRTVGGVAIRTIITDFGELGVAIDRFMPSGALLVASMEECAPCFLPTPGKGYFFEEALGAKGSYDAVQLYGDIGLEYGNPLKHGLLLGLTTKPSTKPIV